MGSRFNLRPLSTARAIYEATSEGNTRVPRLCRDGGGPGRVADTHRALRATGAIESGSPDVPVPRSHEGTGEQDVRHLRGSGDRRPADAGADWQDDRPQNSEDSA